MLASFFPSLCSFRYCANWTSKWLRRAVSSSISRVLQRHFGKLYIPSMWLYYVDNIAVCFCALIFSVFENYSVSERGVFYKQLPITVIDIDGYLSHESFTFIYWNSTECDRVFIMMKKTLCEIGTIFFAVGEWLLGVRKRKINRKKSHAYGATK